MTSYKFRYSDLMADKRSDFRKPYTTKAASSRADQLMARYRKRQRTKRLRAIIAIVVLVALITSFVVLMPEQAKSIAIKTSSFGLVERSADASIQQNKQLQEALKNWDMLDEDAKELAASQLIDAELYELHVPYRSRLKVCKLFFGFAGAEDNLTHTVTIDRETLYTETADEIVNIVSHECRHLFQIVVFDCRAKSHPLFQKCELPENSQEFVIGRLTYAYFGKAYYTNALEVDACSYAEERQDYYRTLLNL